MDELFFRRLILILTYMPIFCFDNKLRETIDFLSAENDQQCL